MAEERHFHLDVDEATQRLQEIYIGQLLVPRITSIDEERSPEREGTARGDPRITIMTQHALREELREDVRRELGPSRMTVPIPIRPPDTLEYFVVLPQLYIHFLII